METVYLLHFSEPYKHARHYLGWTKADLDRRLSHHANGTGAGLTRAAAEAGIYWTVARIWKGGNHDFERRLHSQKANPKLCPICNPETWETHGVPNGHESGQESGSQPDNHIDEIPF